MVDQSIYMTEDAVGGMMAYMTGMWFFAMIMSVFFVVVYWKLFVKAGEPGWASLVPFYSNYVLYKMAFGNGWLFLLSFVPIANIVMAIMLPFKLAKAFGKSGAFGAGLLFLSVVFYPVLAFGSAEYIGLDN